MFRGFSKEFQKNKVLGPDGEPLQKGILIPNDETLDVLRETLAPTHPVELITEFTDQPENMRVEPEVKYDWAKELGITTEGFQALMIREPYDTLYRAMQSVQADVPSYQDIYTRIADRMQVWFTLPPKELDTFFEAYTDLYQYCTTPATQQAYFEYLNRLIRFGRANDSSEHDPQALTEYEPRHLMYSDELIMLISEVVSDGQCPLPVQRKVEQIVCMLSDVVPEQQARTMIEGITRQKRLASDAAQLLFHEHPRLRQVVREQVETVAWDTLTPEDVLNDLPNYISQAWNEVDSAIASDAGPARSVGYEVEFSFVDQNASRKRFLPDPFAQQLLEGRVFLPFAHKDGAVVEIKTHVGGLPMDRTLPSKLLPTVRTLNRSAEIGTIASVHYNLDALPADRKTLPAYRELEKDDQPRNEINDAPFLEDPNDTSVLSARLLLDQACVLDACTVSQETFAQLSSQFAFTDEEMEQLSRGGFLHDLKQFQYMLCALMYEGNQYAVPSLLRLYSEHTLPPLRIPKDTVETVVGDEKYTSLEFLTDMNIDTDTRFTLVNKTAEVPLDDTRLALLYNKKIGTFLRIALASRTTEAPLDKARLAIISDRQLESPVRHALALRTAKAPLDTARLAILSNEWLHSDIRITFARRTTELSLSKHVIDFLSDNTVNYEVRLALAETVPETPLDDTLLTLFLDKKIDLVVLNALARRTAEAPLDDARMALLHDERIDENIRISLARRTAKAPFDDARLALLSDTRIDPSIRGGFALRTTNVPITRQVVDFLCDPGVDFNIRHYLVGNVTNNLPLDDTLLEFLREQYVDPIILDSVIRRIEGLVLDDETLDRISGLPEWLLQTLLSNARYPAEK